MDSGTGLVSAVNVASHGEEAFNAPFTLGQDPAAASRYLIGTLDDTRVYTRALSPTEISELNTFHPDSYATWAIENQVVSPMTDDDGDGLSGFVEFCFGPQSECGG